MRRRSPRHRLVKTVAIVSLVVLGNLTLPRARANPLGDEDLPATSSTSTGTFSHLFQEERPPRPVGLEPERLLLSLPGSIVELAFVPVIPVLIALERYRVVDRLIDLFTNDELTFAAAPIIEPFNTSGLGFGGVVAANEPLGSPDRLIVLGLVRLNGDRQLSIDFGRRIPPLSGRVLNFSARYEVDRDIGWFGLGSDQDFSDQRLIRRDEVQVTLGATELFPWAVNVDGAVNFGYRRRSLSTGSGSQAPPLEADGEVALPPGFDRTIDYLELGLQFRYDTRDGLGHTTRGIVWTLEANGSRGLAESEDQPRSGGLRATTQFNWFIPVLPRNRVLLLSAGVSAAYPLFVGEEVALHQLVNLGGSDILRGYQPDRFIDRFGWWGSAEYRFLLTDYGGSLAGFSGSFFVDVGRTAESLDELVPGLLPWSAGVGILAETDIALLGRVQVAVSPDGVRFSVGVGEPF